MPVMAQKSFSVVKLIAFNGVPLTPLIVLRTSSRSLLVSTTRLVILYGVSTSRKSVAFPRYRFIKMVQNVVSLVVYGFFA